MFFSERYRREKMIDLVATVGIIRKHCDSGFVYNFHSFNFISLIYI